MTMIYSSTEKKMACKQPKQTTTGINLWPRLELWVQLISKQTKVNLCPVENGCVLWSPRFLQVRKKEENAVNLSPLFLQSIQSLFDTYYYGGGSSNHSHF